jgi:DNA sulfur modification protein DndC
VDKDKAMEAMIDSGESWMEPLLDFRDLLSETQDPTKKPIYRELRRRNGRVQFIGESDSPVPGPYKLEFCKALLRRLLETQVLVQKHAPLGEAPQLIHEAELHAIRRIWRSERGDWQDSVPTIVRESLGRDLDWVIEDHVTFTAEDGRLLEDVCSNSNVPTDLVVRLLEVERSAHGLKRRHQVHSRIEDVLNREWRDMGDLQAERRLQLGQSEEATFELESEQAE